MNLFHIFNFIRSCVFLFIFGGFTALFVLLNFFNNQAANLFTIVVLLVLMALNGLLWYGFIIQLRESQEAKQLNSNVLDDTFNNNEDL